MIPITTSFDFARSFTNGIVMDLNPIPVANSRYGKRREAPPPAHIYAHI